jgi:hypothetical protein
MRSPKVDDITAELMRQGSQPQPPDRPDEAEKRNGLLWATVISDELGARQSAQSTRTILRRFFTCLPAKKEIEPESRVSARIRP